MVKAMHTSMNTVPIDLSEGSYMQQAKHCCPLAYTIRMCLYNTSKLARQHSEPDQAALYLPRDSSTAMLPAEVPTAIRAALPEGLNG